MVLDYAAVHTAGVTRAVLEAAAEDRAAARPRPALVTAVAFSDDGRLVAGAEADGNVQVRRLEEERQNGTGAAG